MIIITLPFFFQTVINKTVCSACLQDYSTLNSHFKDIRKTTGGKICMDLVDMVGIRVFNTSEVFHCRNNRMWMINSGQNFYVYIFNRLGPIALMGYNSPFGI